MPRPAESGVDAVVRTICPRHFSETAFMQRCGSTIEEYVEGAALRGSPIDRSQITYPAQHQGKRVQFGNVTEMSARVASAAPSRAAADHHNVATRPTSGKTALCIERDRRLAVINTVLAWRSTCVRSGRHRQRQGDFGPAIKPIALLRSEVYEVAAPRNIPIIGQGGIGAPAMPLDSLSPGHGDRRGHGAVLRSADSGINSGVAEYLAANDYANGGRSWARSETTNDVSEELERLSPCATRSLTGPNMRRPRPRAGRAPRLGGAAGVPGGRRPGAHNKFPASPERSASDRVIGGVAGVGGIPACPPGLARDSSAFSVLYSGIGLLYHCAVIFIRRRARGSAP